MTNLCLEDLDLSFSPTQIHMCIANYTRLYHRMVGSIYKDALGDKINDAFELLNKKLRYASKTELSLYNWFRRFASYLFKYYD